MNAATVVLGQTEEGAGPVVNRTVLFPNLPLGRLSAMIGMVIHVLSNAPGTA